MAFRILRTLLALMLLLSPLISLELLSKQRVIRFNHPYRTSLKPDI